MVLPDGVQRDRAKPRVSPWGMMALGLVALLVGAVFVGQLTNSGPQAIEELPAPTPAEVESAEHEWERVQTMPHALAFNVLNYRGQLLAFTSRPLEEDAELKGLEVWRSVDGTSWEREDGSLIDPQGRVHTVASTSLGIVAFGFTPYGEAERAWLSIDGDYWIPMMDGIPFDRDEFLRTNEIILSRQTSVDLEGTPTAFGADARLVTVTAMDDQAVALVSRPPDRSRPYDAGTVEIWTARH